MTEPEFNNFLFTLSFHSFVCDNCLKKANKTRKENKYAAKSKWRNAQLISCLPAFFNFWLVFLSFFINEDFSPLIEISSPKLHLLKTQGFRRKRPNVMFDVISSSLSPQANKKTLGLGFDINLL